MVSSVYGKIFVSAYLDACSHMCLACIQFSGNASGFWMKYVDPILGRINVYVLELRKWLVLKFVAI